jgi:hypothetical protein
MLSPLYGQLSPLRIPTSIPFDEAALAYIAAVESADGAALEDGVKSAINSFIRGCKEDGIWTALKSSCILAGARTLSGALVPLVGTAPTNNNFVSADFNRKTGLKGNGTTKYLNSNRAHNADPQNNAHLAVRMNVAVFSGTRYSIGADSATCFSGVLHGGASSSNLYPRLHNGSTALAHQGNANTIGFYGVARNASANYVRRRPSASSATITNTSSAADSNNIMVFGASQINGTIYSSNIFNGSLSFYSIGENLDLALLDTRVSNLMTDLAAAIP